MNYDGAASMSSQKVSISAHAKETALLGWFFHCTVHALSLATSQVIQVDIVRNALGGMESIIIFLTDRLKAKVCF